MLRGDLHPTSSACKRPWTEQVTRTGEMCLRGYGHVGVGRDDGRSAGEFCAIFFDRGRFDELERRHVLAGGADRPSAQAYDFRAQTDLHVGAAARPSERSISPRV